MRVDLLFQHPQVVPDHDDFVEEDFQGHLLGLQRRVGRVQHRLAAVPAQPQLCHNGIRFLQPQLRDRRRQGLLDKLLERQIQAAHCRLGVHRLQSAGLGSHRAFDAVIKVNFRHRFRDGFDGARAVLRVADFLTDAKGFNVHGKKLTMVL